jgi:hypothetical protein
MSSGFPLSYLSLLSSLSLSLSFSRRRRSSIEIHRALVDLHFAIKDPRELLRHRPFLRRFLLTKRR